MNIAQIPALLIIFLLCSCSTNSGSLVASSKITYLDSEQWVAHEKPKLAVISDLWLNKNKKRSQNKKIAKNIKLKKITKRQPSSLKETNDNDKDILTTNTESIVSELISQIKTISPEEVTELISKGVDPDLQDEKGNSALHYAVLSVNIPVAKALLKNGASKTLKNNNGETPLDLIKKLKQAK